MQKSLVLAAVVAALALSACGKKEEAAVEAPAAVASEAVAAPAAASEAVAAPAAASEAVAAPAAASEAVAAASAAK
jgi:hypothetical protein